MKGGSPEAAGQVTIFYLAEGMDTDRLKITHEGKLSHKYTAFLHALGKIFPYLTTTVLTKGVSLGPTMRASQTKKLLSETGPVRNGWSVQA